MGPTGYHSITAVAEPGWGGGGVGRRGIYLPNFSGQNYYSLLKRHITS